MSDLLAVEAVNVTKRYGDLVAVDRISVEVGQDEVYGVVGPNGAGKTTFLRMLFGLIRSDGVVGFIESAAGRPEHGGLHGHTSS